ncbi:MAG: histidinol dehydrogenase [Tepidisphaeraceae bacterium]
MIPLLRLASPDDRRRVDALVSRLRLDPKDMALSRGHRAAMVADVQAILADVADRGDAAVVEVARKFDDRDFTLDRLRVSAAEMAAASGRLNPTLRSAIQRSIEQVREFQSHILPQPPAPLKRHGLALSLKLSPLDSVGVYFPGGRASYPSSLIMLAVPAQVAGVKRIVVCTPGSAFGNSDVVLATAHEIGITEMYRVGGVAAVSSLAFGTQTIRPVDKIVGPGNSYVQLAKRMLAGTVGIDGYLGPSEILTLADESANPDFVAADLIAQAEHDPGSCFLLTTSESLAADVVAAIGRQVQTLQRAEPILKALKNESMIVIDPSMDRLLELANTIACEHVSLQTRSNEAVLAKLRHVGAVYVGPYAPVAAGDYVAGPSHCLPTNTTARFASGISVYEFLKRSSVVNYERDGLARDADAITALAEAEQLDAHAASVRVRLK